MTEQTASETSPTAPSETSPTAPKETSPTATRVKKRSQDVATLSILAVEISSYPDGIPQMVEERFAKMHELKVTEAPKGSGRFAVAMAGLKAKPAADRRGAFALWANAARRAVLKARK